LPLTAREEAFGGNKLLPLQAFDPLFIAGHDTRICRLDDPVKQPVDGAIDFRNFTAGCFGNLPKPCGLHVPGFFEHRTGEIGEL
jgi:hypothetical protein